MNKIGKIKSWYIDPDDNRLTHTQHNVLFVNVIDGHKFYTVHHIHLIQMNMMLPWKQDRLSCADKLTMLVSPTFWVE